jgi:mono/diheme cytochrome c family protein
VLSKPPKVSAGPHIAFDNPRFDFGKVKEGVKISHTFKIRNLGDTTLVIEKVLTSCGCTVPTMKVSKIQPGRAEDLVVVLDTSIKQGTVTKEIEVYSNDPAAAKSSVFITATVANLHKDLTAADRLKLFQGKCAVCHWKMGLGLEGEDLFKADCAMCHGDRAQGAVGPALAPRDYNTPAVAAHVKQVTSYGSKKHLSMPGFLEDAGGPLTAKEIESIVKYLAELSAGKKG